MFKFRPAKDANDPFYAMIGIGGPSGSGKTRSALRLATGLAGGEPIAMIDTEAKRGLHYRTLFDYLHADLTAPFSADRYIEAIKDAKAAGAKVIIVDSTSHIHEGPGGLLEQHEAELQRMAGDDFRKRDKVKFTAWIKPKAAHNRFVNTVLQIEAHMIFCFRAKEKLVMVRNQEGKMEPVNAGWTPIVSDRFEYEMAAMLMLPPGSEGVPDHEIPSTKMQDLLRPVFPPDQQISEAMGERLRAWASSGAAGQAPAKGNGRDLQAEARAKADEGTDALRAFWKGLKRPEQVELKPHMGPLKDHAAKIDEAAKEPTDDPFPDEDEESAETAPAEPNDGLSKGHKQYLADMVAELQDAVTPEKIDEILQGQVLSGNWEVLPEAVQQRLSALAEERKGELVQ